VGEPVIRLGKLYPMTPQVQAALKDTRGVVLIEEF
jgi:hypothetical protein